MPSSTPTPVSPTIADQVAYISGVTSGGKVAPTSFQTWNGDVPRDPDGTTPATAATYNSTQSNAAKWAPGGTSAGPSAIGSAGGLQYYYFDPTSNFTASQKVALAAGLKMWSAVANIQFAEITDADAAAHPSKASLDFKSNTGGGTYESAGNGTPSPIGSSQLYNQGAGTFLTVDTGPGGFDVGNFNNGGAGVGVILHEEGHFMGLGHPGPYNGAVNPATQQFSAYDSHEYTLMSYINANDPTDKYASSNPNPGATPYGDSTTWMPLDILAIQSLYGVATTGPLSGGQVFGYHDNVSGTVAHVGIHDFFDFSAITTPVVTLYDSGAGNTLDLSGDHSVETIDLRAGHYSSFAGDTDNLAIAYNTAIDTFVGGTAGTNVTVNAEADTIKDSGTGNTVTFTGTFASYKFDVINAGKITVTSIATGITDTLEGVQTLAFSDVTMQTATLGQENHWLVAKDGNWTDGARWLNGNPPTAKEAVTLAGLTGTYRVTVDTAGNAAGSLAVSAPGGSAVTLEIAAAGVLNVHDTATSLPGAGTLALGANGTVKINGGQLNVAGALTNGGGALDVATGATKAASYAQSAGALTIGDGGAEARLVLAGTFSEAGGTAMVKDQGRVEAGSVSVSGSSLTIKPTGSVTDKGTASFTANAVLDNSGAFKVDGALAFKNATVTDAGTITAPSAAFTQSTFTETGSGSLAVTGALSFDDTGATVAKGATLTADQLNVGGTLVGFSNTLTDAGTVMVKGDLNQGTSAVGGTIAVATGGVLDLGGSTNGVSLNFTGNGRIEFLSSSTAVLTNELNSGIHDFTAGHGMIDFTKLEFHASDLVHYDSANGDLSVSNKEGTILADLFVNQGTNYAGGFMLRPDGTTNHLEIVASPIRAA